MWPGALCLVFLTSLEASLAHDKQYIKIVDKGDESLDHLQHISIPHKWNEKELLIRGRRLINNKEYNLWPKAVVPYTIQKEVLNQKAEYLKVIGVYEANACFRFVPWNETVGEIYGLGHQGHLRFIPSGGCFVIATSVKKRKSGQPVSCCHNEACLHELGHSLGLAHEQENHLRAGWIRINYGNIWPTAHGIYRLTTNKDYIGNYNFPHDISSVMHYQPWDNAFGIGSSTIKFQELHFHHAYFTMFKELAESYKCNQYSPCDGKILGCVNEGYTSIVYGKCQCACPEGLDPASLCAKPLKKVVMSWPKGQYGLPMTKDGCPSEEFQMGSVHIYGVTVNMNAKEKIKQEFCTRILEDDNFNTHEEEKWNWPLGNYCIYKVGEKCPFGFTPGSVSFGQATAGDIAGHIPSGRYGQAVSIDFCCQYRGFHWSPSYLPTKKQFSVFKLSQSCQTITGMKYNEEEVFFYGRSFNYTGSVPRLGLRTGTMIMTLCHYIKTDMNCGDGIVLDNDHKSTTIEFSAKGKADMECTWVIRGDNEKGTLVLDFEEMNIKKNGNKCVDRVEVRHALMGQTGLNYCGQELDHSIRSITNKIVMRFFTTGNSDSSFKANIKWIPNGKMCYDTYDRGVSYDGLVNYTRLFKPCLPWAQVGKCPHHPFKEGDRRDNLDGNYCRNPDNSFRPWCYTDVKDCQRDHCDVCGVEIPHDKIDYCGKLKNEGFCQRDAKIAAKYCPLSCMEVLTPRNKTTHKHGDIKCGNPNIPSDGTLLRQLKESYNLGERIHFKCKSSSNVVSSTCMTSGNWSSVPYACPDCPFGSVYFREFCYVIPQDNGADSYKDATIICDKLGGVVPAPTNQEENSVVRRTSAYSYTWIGINDIKKEGTWVYDDGLKITWDNWRSNEPNGRQRENCASMDNNGRWLDIPCTRYHQQVVCKLPKNNQHQCYDFYGDHCARLLTDSSDMCSNFPKYARKFCRKTCGMCDNNQGSCTAEAVDSNVEMLDSRDSRKILFVGEKVVFGCKKYTFNLGGDEVRSCNADGVLTGQDLRCGDCPLDYISSKYACHGLLQGQLLTFDEARDTCSKVGGYIAMAKSPAENVVINTVALGQAVWLGIRVTNDDEEFIWEDESLVHWVGDQEIKMSSNNNCVVLGKNKKWTAFRCNSNIKYTTVCTIPKIDNYACFDMKDKGVTYDGTVNVTVTGIPCLAWTETTECPYHAYQATINLYTFDHNYCRNPDNSPRPWCYTHACNKEYCDVCKAKAMNKDLKTDCAVRRDKSICTEDEATARKECAGTCSDLLPDSGHNYFRNVKCQQPVALNDGVIISKSRLEYNVGDVVSIKCKHNKFVINMTCLTSGSWTQAGLVCSECPVGYSSKEGMCYGWYDLFLTHEEAIQKCAEVGGFLPNPNSDKENELIKSLNRQKYLWLGGKRDSISWLFAWQDGSNINWTNWNEGYPKNFECLLMNKDGLWENTDCNFIPPDFGLMCVVPSQTFGKCGDILDKQCSHLLVETPSMCKKYEQFSRNYCPKTCGVCTNGITKCDLPPTNKAIVSSTSSSLSVGDYVSYQCQKFKYPSSGNTKRACQVDGTLTGSDLECDNTCPIGALSRDGICYTYMKTWRTYLNAREDCKALNGLIAFPRDKVEMDFFISLMKYESSIWIGITDMIKEGDFVFEDGTRPSWAGWEPGEPNNIGNEDCGIQHRGRGWNDVKCQKSLLQFICASPLLSKGKCYDAKDSGVTYDGLVNVSKSGDICAPWAIATNCPYHPFKSNEESNILYGSYCRNPDATFKPWCYTDAQICEKQYCDVCNVHDAQHATDYTAVKCESFSLPDGSKVVNDKVIKPEYKVGDVVKIACDERKDNITSATCLTSGKWSPIVLHCKDMPPDCKDGLVNRCVHFLDENPKMCEEFPDFGNEFCAKTCGVCGADDVTCDISSETSSSFTSFANESSLLVGQTITYQCKQNLIKQKGDSIRVCQNNGVLSGTRIVCKGEDDLDSNFVGLSELKNGDKELPFINVFFADNVLYKIKKHGVIIAWEYYSDSPMKTAFQVWRQVNGVRYELIGQNIVTTGQEKQERKNIPPEERIEVQPDDVIGIMNAGSGGLKFTVCEIQKHPDWGLLRWSRKMSSLTSIGADDIISFSTGDNACLLIPMRAIMVITE